MNKRNLFKGLFGLLVSPISEVFSREIPSEKIFYRGKRYVVKMSDLTVQDLSGNTKDKRK